MYLLTHPFFYFSCYSLLLLSVSFLQILYLSLRCWNFSWFHPERDSQVVQCKKSNCQCKRYSFDSWVGKTPWRRKWQPTPVFLPGKSPGQRNLVGYGPWSQKRIGHDLATKYTHTHTHTHTYTHTHFTLRPLLHILHSLLSIWLTLLASLSIYD